MIKGGETQKSAALAKKGGGCWDNPSTPILIGIQEV